MLYPRVLVPTDFSEGSAAVAQMAVGLAPLGVTEIVLLHIVDTTGLEKPVVAMKRTEARAEMDALLERLDKGAMNVTGEINVGDAPACVIRRVGQLGIDLIVLGSTGKKAFEEMVTGSLSSQVTREARIPVLHVLFTALAGLDAGQLQALGAGITGCVLHPTDFSETSGHALDAAVDVSPGRLILAHAVDGESMPPEEVAALEQSSVRRLERIRDRIVRSGVRAEVRVEPGDAVSVMLGLAVDEGATLIVLGSTGKSLMSETIVGSVSRELLRKAPMPALVVH
jgi:nucleotide-binding universal stress UspA family protein